MSDDDAAKRAKEILAEERARSERIANEEAARVKRDSEQINKDK